MQWPEPSALVKIAHKRLTRYLSLPVKEDIMHDFQFTASRNDYFRLYWINFFFSLITLGIYSAWSKVRLKQYLLGHTHLAGAAFDYRANPLVILRGRLIAVVLLVFYYFTDYLPYKLFLAILLIILILLPFFIIGALRFQSRNTYHRNLQFNFNADYWQTFYIFSVLYFLSLISLGLLYPLYEYKKRMLLMNQYYYADQKFKFKGDLAVFYRIFFIGAFYFLVLLIPIILTFAAEIDFKASFSDNASGLLFAEIIDTLIRILLITLPWYFSYQYLRINYLDYTLNHSTVGNIRIKSRIRFWPYFKIITTNSMLIALTLSLYFPAAKIRKLQYLYAHISIQTDKSIDQINVSRPQNASGLGDAINDATGLDIGL